jgi:hypothetical protein
LSAQWETPSVVPSRESNSGLPYSKPTRYQLSHAAPDPDSRAWKLTKIKKRTWFCAFQKGFCTFLGMFS